MGTEPNSAPIRRGTRANQPRASQAWGLVYYVTDEGVTEQSNGSVWETLSDAGGGGGGSALAVLDEGVSKTAAATSLNFTGAGVTATNTGGAVTIAIPGTTPSSVQTEAASYNVAAGDEGHYIRMTGAGTKTVTVRPESEHALPANGEWHFRNVGAGNLTLAEGDGVSINLPTGGTLVVAQGSAVTIKRVAVDVFDLIGSTVAA